MMWMIKGKLVCLHASILMLTSSRAVELLALLVLFALIF
jgi:hypothetical protein